MNPTTKKKLQKLDPALRAKIEELIEGFVEHISVLYDEATRDHKTGVYNNRFLESVLDIEIEQTKRGDRSLSMIIIDIDFFKKINDTYGHIKADEMLVKLAKILQTKTRKSDIVARFGGEEFIVLLSETDKKKAEGFAERLRRIIKEDRFLKKYSMTVSCGIAEFNKKKDTKKTFKIRADEALYKAKRNGRDQVVAL